MSTGWISLHRNILNWYGFSDPKMLKLWIYLLIRASHKSRKYLNIDIRRGQLITSRKRLSKELEMSEQMIRNRLKNLQKSGEITVKTTNKFSIVTICKYEYYQNKKIDKEPKKEPAKKSRRTNKKTTNNNLHNNLENNKIKETDFIDDIIDLFIKNFNYIRDYEYVITNKGKERQCAGKLLKIFREKHPDATKSEVIKGFDDYFEKCLKIQDTWFYENMSLPIIISKFNIINQKIYKNGTYKRNNRKCRGATDTEIASVLFRHFAGNGEN